MELPFAPLPARVSYRESFSVVSPFLQICISVVLAFPSVKALVHRCRANTTVWRQNKEARSMKARLNVG